MGEGDADEDAGSEGDDGRTRGLGGEDQGGAHAPGEWPCDHIGLSILPWAVHPCPIRLAALAFMVDAAPSASTTAGSATRKASEKGAAGGVPEHGGFIAPARDAVRVARKAPRTAVPAPVPRKKNS